METYLKYSAEAEVLLPTSGASVVKTVLVKFSNVPFTENHRITKYFNNLTYFQLNGGVRSSQDPMQEHYLVNSEQLHRSVLLL